VCKYNSGDIEIRFEAEEEVSDYGVPGSPVFIDPDYDTIRVTSMEIMGIEVDFDSLPVALQNEILNNADNWERE